MNVIVVGAGIAGLSTAWSLAKAGHNVTILEQGASVPNPLGASGDHHRIIRRAYRASTGYGNLVTEAYAAWDELWGDLGERHLDPRGFLCVSLEADDKADEYREGLEAGSFPFELHDAVSAAIRWRFLAPGSFRYACFSRDGGVLHCRRIAAGLVTWLREHGVSLYEGSRVVSVDPDTGRLDLESGEWLRADRVVVTAGAWVLKLFPEFGGELKTYRTAVVYLEPPADLAAAWGSAPVVLVGGNTDGYIIPPSGGAGLKFGSGLHKVETSDADWNREPVEGEGEAIRDLFSPLIARVTGYGITGVVTCAYTFTSDERFWAAEKGRCLIVSPCSGHGYKFGAAVGRRVAAAVDDGDVENLRRWLAGGPALRDAPQEA
jgi:sarcosine oxidase